MVIIRAISSYRTLTNAVSHGSILDPVIFNIFVIYRDDEVEYALREFIDDTKLEGVADTPEAHLHPD